MNKWQYIDQMYNSAFKDELEKISINLTGLKSLGKVVKSRSLNHISIDPVKTHISGNISLSKSNIGSPVGIANKSANKSLAEFSKQNGIPVINMDKRLSSKIINPKGGAVGFFGKLGPNNPAIKIKSKKSKEIINRLVGAHELNESKVKKYLPFQGHNSTDVIAFENNLIRSLPKKYNSSKNVFKKMRDTESYFISNYYPGFEYGKTKLSPAARKHINRRWGEDLHKSMEEVRRMVKILKEKK